MPWSGFDARARLLGAMMPPERHATSGDLNGDGVVNLLDVLRLRDLILPGSGGATPAELEAGDLFQDGRLDSLDLTILHELVLRPIGTTSPQPLPPVAIMSGPPAFANGTFEAGMTGWQVFRNKPVNTITSDIDPEFPGNHVAHFNIQDASGSGWFLNLVQFGDQGLNNLLPATTYTLSFRARASVNRIVKLELSVNTPSYRNLGLLKTVNLSTQTLNYNVTFRTVDSLPATGMLFAIVPTAIPGDIWLDDVAIAPTPLITYAGQDVQVASFNSAESWDGGAIDFVNVHEGDAGLRLSANADDMQATIREVPMNLALTPWELTFWVYTATPTTLGRLQILMRSGPDTDKFYASWALSGLTAGWNLVVVPSSAFFKPYWYINNFSWQEPRTIAFKLEANGNGATSVTLDDLRIQPQSFTDRRLPVVSHVTVVSVTATSATIRWVTQENATATLHYGTTTNYGTTRTASTPDTTQQIVLTGLTGSTAYHGRITATDGAGLQGSSGDFTFVTEPAIAPVPANPNADFNIGLYNVYGESDVAKLAGGPFSNVHSFQFSTCSLSVATVQSYLDKAQAAGVKVMLGVSCNPIDGSLSMPIVYGFKYHPALSGWYMYSEPEVAGVSPTDLTTIYNMIRTADPNTSRPIIISSSTFGQPAFNYTSFDRVLLDAYPVPFNSFGWLTDKLDAAKADGRYWGYVHQAFQWDVDRWIGSGAGPSRYPSAAEMRAMPYLAINRGARQVWAFSYNDLNDLPGSEWKWNELLTIGRELKRLKPMLASTTTPLVTATASAPEIDLGIRRYSQREYVIAVNKSANTVSSSLNLTHTTGTTATRIGDNQTLSLVAGSVSDVWGPYDVRIYRVVPEDVDIVRPTVAFVAPTAGAYVTGSTTVTVDAQDNVQVSNVRIFADGAPIGYLTTPPYSIIWDTSEFEDGQHALSTIATDPSGNFTAAGVSINVDNNPPETVAMTAPADGAVLSGSSVLVSADASDAVDVAGVQFRLDGANLGTLDTESPYEVIWSNPTDGAHVLTAIAQDYAGHSTTATNVSITIDNAGPVVAIASPANGVVLSGTSVVVSATASDAQGIAGVQFKLDGVDLGPLDTASPYEVTWSNPTDGTHVLSAIAQDGSGNSASATGVSVAVDNTPPAVTVTAPTNGAFISGNTIVLGAAASDAQGIASVQFKLDGSNLGALDTTSPYEVTWSSPTGGAHILTAVATDNASHSTTAANVSVTIDNTNPVTTLTAPANGSVVSGTAVTVSATATDNDLVAGVQFTLDGSNLGSEDTSSPYGLSWDCTAATEGSHVLAAITRDRAGNQSTHSVTVTVDNTFPVVAVTAPTNGAVLSGASVVVSATASDASGISGVQFKLDGADLGALDTTSPYQVTWSSPTDGAHVLTAIATDNSGHSTTATSVSVTVDNTNPVVAVTAPTNGAVLSGASVVVSATASDANGISGVQFRLDGADLGALDTTSPYQVTWSSPTDGAHVLTAIATDNSGHSTTATSVSVTVDNTNPVVAVTAPTNGALLSGVSVVVSATATDANGISGVQFRLDGADLGALDTSSPYQVTWSSPTDGAHVLTAVATDNTAHSTTATSVSVTVDNTFPVVAVTAPTNGAVLSGASVVVSATASDANGIASVQFKLDGADLGTLDTTSPYQVTWSSPTDGAMS